MIRHIIISALLVHCILLNAQEIIEKPLPKEFSELEKNNTPKEFKFDSITVYAICTGYISTDKKFPEPVFVWLIKTPAGNYLVDGGLSPSISDPDYFKGFSKPFFKKQFDFYTYKSNNLIAQLNKIGVKNTIKAIILTHGHFDHIGYLDQLGQTPILLSRTEKDQIEDKGQLGGYQKGTYKSIDFKRAELTSLKDFEIKTLNKYISIFQTGQHTKGHIMIVANTGSKNILFSGDINLKMISPKGDLYKFVDKTYDLKILTLFFNHDQKL